MFNIKMSCCLILIAINALPAVNAEDVNKSLSIVPDSEHEMAARKQLSGPTKTVGIESVKQLGNITLENDFPALKGRQLRARELTINPGGIVAVHEHDTRPGVAYILEGEIIEHRSDQPDPILRTKGAVAFEKSGISHWWENKSDAVVRALVVDIIKEN